MTIGSIRPSTMVGIRSLANELKRDRGIKHSAALDVAAKQAGFEGYRHAQNVLEKRLVPKPKVKVYLTAYWKDRKSGETGRETLEHELSVPWRSLVTDTQLKAHRALIGFRGRADDHLELSFMDSSPDEARRHVCAASRALDFMDATRLRPSSGSSRVYPEGDPRNAPPGSDHVSIWFDPSNKRYVIADEPYEQSVERDVAKRAAWAERFDWQHAKPNWRGMYYPDGGSRLYLFSSIEKGVALEPLVRALDELPEPATESNWTGVSAPFSIWMSPGTGAKREAKKAKPRAEAAPKRPRAPAGSTVEYHQMFVRGALRRPNGKMPLEMHERLGQILKGVLAKSRPRRGVYNRLNEVRSDLEEWMGREHRDADIPNDRYLAVYYGDGALSVEGHRGEDTKSEFTSRLAEVQQVLIEHYPDTAPLRAMLSKIEAARKSAETWR
jgi:hypothetical protein